MADLDNKSPGCKLDFREHLITSTSRLITGKILQEVGVQEPRVHFLCSFSVFLYAMHFFLCQKVAVGNLVVCLFRQVRWVNQHRCARFVVIDHMEWTGCCLNEFMESRHCRKYFKSTTDEKVWTLLFFAKIGSTTDMRVKGQMKFLLVL